MGPIPPLFLQIFLNKRRLWQAFFHPANRDLSLSPILGGAQLRASLNTSRSNKTTLNHYQVAELGNIATEK